MSLVLTESLPDGLRRIVLNRVDKLNALSGELVRELAAAVEQARVDAENSKIRAVAFASATPKAFCVGADLAERMTMSEAQVSATLSSLRALMDAVAALPVPTFALVEGAAFGGGFELALACDFRFFGSKAQVGLTETKLAIIPGAGGTQRLARLVGVARAKELIFRARRLSATEAHALGLGEVVTDDTSGELKAWMTDIAATGPVALRAAKRAIDRGIELPLHDALHHERACYDLVLPTQDRREGLKAFAEKRTPRYDGR